MSIVPSQTPASSHAVVTQRETSRTPAKLDATQNAPDTGFAALFDTLANTKPAEPSGLTLPASDVSPAEPVGLLANTLFAGSEFDAQIADQLADPAALTLGVADLSGDAAAQLAAASLRQLSSSDAQTAVLLAAQSSAVPTLAAGAAASQFTQNVQAASQKILPGAASSATRASQLADAANTQITLSSATKSDTLAWSALASPLALGEAGAVTDGAPKTSLAHHRQAGLQLGSVLALDDKSATSTLALNQSGRAPVPADWLAQVSQLQPERSSGKGSKTSAAGGFAPLFAAPSNTEPNQSIYEVAPSSASVAPTALAETVSFWASQGVQNAELKLDGLASEPVEVSISLHGDQAQIDFRSDQPGVRQVLEAAASELKQSFANEGLQLVGVSVGLSERRQASGDPAPGKTQVRKINLLNDQPMAPLSARSANHAVGQSLDLFV